MYLCSRLTHAITQYCVNISNQSSFQYHNAHSRLAELFEDLAVRYGTADHWRSTEMKGDGTKPAKGTQSSAAPVASVLPLAASLPAYAGRPILDWKRALIMSFFPHPGYASSSRGEMHLQCIAPRHGARRPTIVARVPLGVDAVLVQNEFIGTLAEEF